MLDSITPYKNSLPQGIELPTFKPSEEDLAELGLSSHISNTDMLKALCNRGVKRLGISSAQNRQEYYDRAKYELETLEKLKLVDYMLLVWDIMNFVRRNNIPRGPARGSCGGCLVAYLIGITERVDPIKYKLIFERFLSVDRVEPFEVDGRTFLKDCADIDVDISYLHRPKVLEYVAKKYFGSTAKILTISTLSGKAMVKSAHKIVDGASEEQANHVSNMVDKIFGVVRPLADCYTDSEEFKTWADKHTRAFRVARKLEGLNKNFGIHASGVAITAGQMLDTFPTQSTKDGEVVTAWDMDVIGGICVKVDILGIKTLDMLAIAEQLSGKKASDIDPEDPSIYKQFENLNHKYGLFQIETDAGFKVTQQIKPTHFSQLSDIVAINRPGALAFVPDYVAYKNGDKPIPKVHPIIDDILKDTGGVLLMQEQTMQILNRVYGFSMVDANKLRKVIGKKKRDEVGAWEEKIRKAGDELKIETSITDWYWNAIKASADYQFNACLAEDTIVEALTTDRAGIPLEHGKPLSDVKIGDWVRAKNVERGHNHYVKVANIFRQKAIVVEVIANCHEGFGTFIIKSSLDHKYLCSDGAMRPLWMVIRDSISVVTQTGFAKISGINRFIGLIDTIDLEVDHEDHNFYANGIVVSNSHSRAYSFITAFCAYFKANFPREYFLAALRMSKHESDPRGALTEITQEMTRFGIKLLPPDLARSAMEFEVDGDGIRYGLSSVKGISDKTMENFEKFVKSDRPTRFSTFLAAKEAGLNIGTLSALIQAGTMDSFGIERTSLVFDAQVFNILSDKEKSFIVTTFPDSTEPVIDLVTKMSTLLNEKGKPLINSKRLGTITKKITKYQEIKEKNSRYQKFANWYFEKQLLGYSYSEQLSKCFEADLHSSLEVQAMKHRSSIRMVGVVKERKIAVSKNGNKYMRLVLSDEFGDITFMFMDNRQGEKLTKFLESGREPPEEGDIWYAAGQKPEPREGETNPMIFADTVARVNEKIYFKLRDLDKESTEDGLKEPTKE